MPGSLEHRQIECHEAISSDTDCIDVLAEASGLSKRQIRDAMRKGAVWLTKAKSTARLRRHNRDVPDGSVVHLYYDERILSTSPTPCDLIADEGHYSVWHKPYGVLSQGSKWGDHCTVYRWASLNLKPERPVFTVHRLDRAASGLILIAHRKRTATQLAKLFESRDILKRYRAVVHGLLEEEISIDQPIDGRQAVSRIRPLEQSVDADTSLVEVTIGTGRKHQIRRHLSGIGLPVVGDRLYGRDGDTEDLRLTACELGFVDPQTGAEKSYWVGDERCPVLGVRKSDPEP